VIRRLRLLSGLVMLAYVTTHLINHAMGLVSLSAMDEALFKIYPVWASRPGTTLLYGAFAIHYCLALYALWSRRTLRMSGLEATQLALGFAIPFLLVEHVVSTRVADTWLHGDYGYYVMILAQYRIVVPWRGLNQLVVLLVAWNHAMIGLRYNLMLRPWYGRWQPYLYAAALLLPTLAILGVFEGGAQVVRLAQDPGYLDQLLAAHPRARPPEDVAYLDALTLWLRLGFLGALLSVLLARVLRWQFHRWRGIVRLTYPGGRVVEIVPGLSVLEASRIAGIPHASVCGGRGRCSTCRIRVGGEHRNLPPASPAEHRVLQRVGAAPDVRLACQLRPLAHLAVTPLLPSSARASDGYRQPAYLHGVDKEIAILFADIRAFTRLAERKLPYDVVFLLNRYFAEMGHAVERSGGRIDKFIGDGVMALFGLDDGPERGCRDALAAARAMAEQLDELNRALAQDLAEPLRIGIGIHVGPAIVGEMGYGTAVSVTAVGDCVNTASRLETLTKDYGAQLVVSEALIERARVALPQVPRHEIEIRGRVERLRILALASALDVPADALGAPGRRRVRA
jgi:adenylate cyclase